RGRRQDLLVELLNLLCDSEDALVVNNNAAAVLLILETLAKRKEVVVSRGELIEIGGSFRIPEIMKKSGTILVEVGTTNRTNIMDYERALGPKTALVLSVHPSNFHIKGFTSHVKLYDLSHLCKKYNLPLVRDLGSGAFLKIKGINEPTVSETVRQGADIVSFSGDKLAGGPQAGIIVGKKEYLKSLKNNDLFRALRVDKITYSVLENLLLAYIFQKDSYNSIPVLKILETPVQELKNRALKIMNSIKKNGKIKVEIIKSESFSGGGSQPNASIPSIGLTVSCEKISSEAFAKKLREQNPPIIGRIENDHFILDMRTILPDDVNVLIKILNNLF
ncbi:MAG: L-seryl-tRNA(Sec) selenium transferase, partial [Elusimicrobiota bacterium]